MDTFAKFDEYEQILTGAHRKPPPILGAPALVCHLAFWRPLVARGAPSREGRILFVDSYLRDIYKRLKVSKNPIIQGFTILGQVDGAGDDKYVLFQDVIKRDTGECIPNDPALRSGANQAIVFEFEWHYLRVKILFELHSEYLSISNLIDLSPFVDRVDQERFYQNDDVFKSVKDTFESLRAKLNKNDRISANYRSIHNFLYHSIWTRFHTELLHSQSIQLSELGDIFADFRGIVLGASQPFLSLPPSQREAFQPPFYRSGEGPMPWSDARELNGNLIGSLWPFLVSETRVDFAKYEFTASTFLDGRALYVTALGAQPSALPASERFPLLYFVYANTPTSWQLGRLVNHINHLGTVRLAAIVNHNKLVDAGHELRVVEKQIVSAQNSVLGMVARSTQTTLDDIKVEFSAIEEKMNRIASIIDGGIEYRIERARYYIKQFERGVAGLRIRRIEGYLPYDLFVRRRLEAIFDYIDMLGIRFARVQRDINYLFSYYLTQSNISIEKAANENQWKIERLQAAAELALLGALLPYYVGSLFQHILEYLKKFENWGPLIWIGIWAFFLYWAGMSFREHYEEKWLHICSLMKQAGRAASKHWHLLAIAVGLLATVAAVVFSNGGVRPVPKASGLEAPSDPSGEGGVSGQNQKAKVP